MAKKDAPKGYPRGRWTKEAVRVLEERYLMKDSRGRIVETPDGMAYRVAREVAAAEKIFGADEKKAERVTREFYELIIGRLFMPNSPTLMNAGKGNNLQYSGCYVLPVGDSLTEIFDAIKNTAIVHQSGGGTGFSFSSLRPKGSRVKSTHGVASGPVSFMRVFDAATNEVKQGGARRGANMGVLRVDHPDIEEFVESKLKGGITNFNISVAVTDVFMRAVEKDKEYWLYDPYLKSKTKKLKAREVFNKIVKGAWANGDPGVIFIDRVNAGPANPVPAMGPVAATNPCVVGSTLIATESGWERIDKLVKEKKKIKIMNDDRVIGERGITARQLEKFWDNGVKEVWKLQTKGGLELTATADHKIMTTRGWVPLGEIEVGKDKILIQAGEGSFSQEKKLSFVIKKSYKSENGKISRLNLPQEWSRELGQVLGWLVGDGWLRRGDKDCRVGLTFGKEDEPVMKALRSVVNGWYGQDIKPVKRENAVWHLSYHSKYFVDFFQALGVKAVTAVDKEVPEAILTAPREAVIGFLQGLFTADGTVNYARGVNAYVRLTSKSIKLLKQTQLLLLNLGITSRIYDRNRPPRKCFAYKGKEYQNDGVCFELNISRQAVIRYLEKIGFMAGRHLEKTKLFTKQKFYRNDADDVVVAVKGAGKERVYDITEPVTLSMIANGLVVADCGEQPLYSNEACNLGSINLSLMVKKGKKEVDWDKLDRVTRLATRFLDDVIEVNPYPLPEIDKIVKANRRVGLGVMGWADLLFQLEIAYDSREAVGLARKVMKFIQKKAHEESEKLALERGEFPNFKKSMYKDGKPLRNATLTTIAPTGSISIVAGASSGIEPLFALAYKHKVDDRELYFFNPYFEEAAKKQGLDKAIIEKVKSQGNLHGLEVSKKLAKVFVTAHEVEWRGHINTQAAFQAGVDNAVSKTINLPNEAEVATVEKAYLYAYQKGCMGITVYRDRCREEQVLYAGEDKDKGAVEEQRELKVKPRPAVAIGKTYRIETPVGTAFVTVNTNGHNDPFEVFVNVGKVGSDIAADAEALGRLISLNLRLGSDFSWEEVLAQIIEQLEGIGGGESVGFGPNRIRSLADGVAKILKEYLGGKQVSVSQIGAQPNLLERVKKISHRDMCPACGMSALIYEEGCAKCSYCGYNKC